MIDLYSDMFATVKSFDKILSHISFNYDCAIGLEKTVKQNKVDMGNDSIMENK